jgi:acetoacetyl-CoA synthetase
MPSLLRTVVVPYLDPAAGVGAVANAVSWRDLPTVAADAEVRITRVAFDHPLFIMFSSGTTGVPKCIVHCHGGVLLQHLKEHQLHSDVRPGDRLFYFTTCGWMMWNWLVSGLACGATLLLYDGSPFAARARFCSTTQPPRNDPLRHLGQVHRRRRQARPDAGQDARPGGLARHVLDRQPAVAGRLRLGISRDQAGHPARFDFRRHRHRSCFVLGNPVLPVYRGEIQCRGLGMAVDVFDDEGKPVRRRRASWCVPSPSRSCRSASGTTRMAPSIARPISSASQRLVPWRLLELTAHDGMIIYGRSDATLNPGGVRIGTAEIYRQVEQLPEILESLVIGQDWPPGKHDDVRVVLFVKLQEGHALDAALIDRVKKQIRDNTTPRHVPAKVVQVQDIPRTKSGKIVELAVRNVVHAQPVKNVEALANPEALEFFRERPELAD